MMTLKWMIDDVRAFHEKFGAPVNMTSLGFPGARLRKKLLREEVFELGDAIDENEHEGSTEAAANVAREIVDVLYVAIGTAVSLGLPIEEVWQIVQRANMRKEADPAGGKVRKPPGWVDPFPEIVEVLRRHHR